MRLEERVAIVTGGARGIGAGIARCLADEGARVALLDIDGDKAGLISLSRTLALELGPSDVRVNAVCPGLLYTRAWKVLASNIQKSVPSLADEEPYQVFLDIVRRQTPLGREQTPDDVGKLSAFLCSDDARNITGQVIALDGGSTLRGGG